MAKIILLAIAAAPLMMLGNDMAKAGNPEGVSTQLLPLENRGLIVELDPNHLQTAAQEINTSTFGKETSGNVLDLGETLGEDGSTNLPLGIRVFSTLGDPSIGFGGDF